MPDVSAKDQRALSVSLNHIAQAIEKIKGLELLSDEEASRLFKQYLEMNGLDAWKNEPRAISRADSIPDPNFQSSRMFSHLSTEGLNVDGRTFYVSHDPNRPYGTRAIEMAVERMKQEGREDRLNREDEEGLMVKEVLERGNGVRA